MEIEVKMPDLSTTGGELTVLKWLVEVGSFLKRGDALVEVETDKATMAVESAYVGILKRQLVQVDEAVLPGEPIAIIEVKQSLMVAGGPLVESRHHQVDKSADEEVSAEPAGTPTTSSTRPRAGLFARNRTTRRDAETAATPLSTTQRAVARRMLQSKQTIPHYYLQTSACMDVICKYRAESDNAKVIWDAYFACAVAKSLKRFPRMCCRYHVDCLVSEPRGSIGVAFDVDGELYVVPILDAAEKSAVQVSNEIRAAYQDLKANISEESKRLQPADFTITNLGMTPIESFVPIINPPEAAILGIGRVQPQPVVVNLQVVIQQRVTLTLAVDHRIVNGKYAAEFLGGIVEELENS